MEWSEWVAERECGRNSVRLSACVHGRAIDVRWMMLDAGYWVLDAGCWYWVLGTGYTAATATATATALDKGLTISSPRHEQVLGNDVLH